MQTNTSSDSLDDECLLYLLYADKPFELCPVWDAYLMSNQGMSDKNPLVSSDDGQSLEACGSAAIMCSTQYNRDDKFQLSLSSFITNFANQLLPINIGASLTEEAQKIIEPFEENSIPYLMPANNHICGFYDSCIPHLGKLYRTVNADMIDCRAVARNSSVAFTCEWKDWADAINLQNIFDRVPVESPVHIVLCNKVPHTTGAERAGSLVRIVSVGEGFIHLSKIGGLEDPKVRDTLVLIFPFVEMRWE